MNPLPNLRLFNGEVVFFAGVSGLESISLLKTSSRVTSQADTLGSCFTIHGECTQRSFWNMDFIVIPAKTRVILVLQNNFLKSSGVGANFTLRHTAFGL